MAEKTIFWTTGTSNDGLSPYTEAELTNWLRTHFLYNPASEGVTLAGGQLAPSVSSNTVTIADGAALLYGFPYNNSAPVAFVIPIPVVGTTGHRIVLRLSWSNRQGRLTRLSSGDGAAAIPALTQTANTTWDIPICSLTITTLGTVTLTDERGFLHPMFRIGTPNLDSAAVTQAKLANASVGTAQLIDANVTLAKLAANSVGTSQIVDANVTLAKLASDSVDDSKAGERIIQMMRFISASSTNWNSPATSDAQVNVAGGVRMFVGSYSIGTLAAGASGSVAFNYPFSFIANPLCFATSNDERMSVSSGSETTSGMTLRYKNNHSGSLSGLAVKFIVIGPEYEAIP